MLLEFALKCLCALQLVYFYDAAAQAAPRLRVNEAYVDVLVDIGTPVRLECETDAGTVDASFFLNGVEEPLQGTNNEARMIESMSVMYQGRYFCRTNQSPAVSNEIAIIGEWTAVCCIHLQALLVITPTSHTYIDVSTDTMLINN